MSVTRQSLRFKCSVQDCPWRDNEEIHIPWCLGIPDVEHWADKPTHQHYPKKGMGGKNPKSKIVSILCVTCHDRIDNGDWGNDVKEMPGRGKVYFAWDLHGNTLIEKEVMPNATQLRRFDQREVGRDAGRLSDGAEDGTAGAVEYLTAEGQGNAPDSQQRQAKSLSDTDASAPSLSKEESDGLGVQSLPNDQRDGGEAMRQLRPPRQDSSPLTHEQRVAIAQEIKNSEWNRQWVAGDTGNQWIAELGEEAEQYLSDFGYVHETLANILRVCAAIKPPYRNGKLRFSHHVVVYELPPEDQMLRLKECEDNEWSVAEFRRQVKGTKPKEVSYRCPQCQYEGELGEFRDTRVYAKEVD